MTETGIMYDIQRFSQDDGPGIRTLVFFKGCPLRCTWCANPESQSMEPEIGHHYTLCVECGECVKNCPQNAITMVGGDKKISIDRSKCDVCGICVKSCNRRALHIYGYSTTVEDVYKEVIKDMDFYKASGGGVTLSGGEVLMQADFAAALLKRCKEAGINTCVETSGYGIEAQFKKIIPYVDLFLFDLKSLNDEVHKKWIGGSNERILKNLKLIMDSDKEVVIRFPFIPSVNDTEENLNLMLEKMQELNRKAKVRIEIMPYHNYGTGKYVMTHREYKMPILDRPSPDSLEKVNRLFEDAGICCIVHMN